MIASTLLLALVATGTGWYGWVEGFTPIEALYQTVITISTVGFNEVRPLDDSGRLFTVVLILLGVGIMFYVAGTIVEEVVLGRVAEALGVARWGRRRHDMHDHFVICGFGRVGSAVAEEILGHGGEIVVIDHDDAHLAVARDHGMLTVAGDGTEESILVEARTQSARVLVAATESDASNTFIALTARALNPEIFIVAGARSESAESRLRAAGANRVFSMHRIAGRRMALAALQPMVVDVVDAMEGMRPGMVLAELVCADEAIGFEGSTLHEVFAGFDSVRVLGLERPGQDLAVGPPGETILRHGDRLMIYGAQSEIEALGADRPRPGASSTPAAAPTDGTSAG